jgi:predicted lipoprotein
MIGTVRVSTGGAMKATNQPGAGGRVSNIFSWDIISFGEADSMPEPDVSLTEIRIWRMEPSWAGIDARASGGESLFSTIGIASRMSASARFIAALISMRVDFLACRIVTAPPTSHAIAERAINMKSNCVRIE